MKNLKKALSVFLSLMLALGAMAVGGVSASAQDPVYMISSYADLKNFASRVNSGNTSACAKLMNDIDASGYTDWTPIGKDSDNPFTGTFDGDGHVITGLTYNSQTGFAGLFGWVQGVIEGDETVGGIVKNVGLEGGKITGENVGGVAAFNGGTITNCYNTGDVTLTGSSNWFYAGGVVGFNRGTITNCYNTGDVTVTETGSANYLYSGGVAGFNDDGTITNCYNTGDVNVTVTETGTAGYIHTGGVVGHNKGGTITKCYNTGDVTVTVTGTASIISTGGVVGSNIGPVSICYSMGAVTTTMGSATYVSTGGVAGDNNGPVSSCYSTGTVTTKGSATYNDVGGVAGTNYGEITNCYYDKSVCDADNGFGTALTTDEMTAGTYTDGVVTNMPGFKAWSEDSTDDDAVWLVREPDIFGRYYPHLKGFDYDKTGDITDWPARIKNGGTADNPYEISTYSQLRDFASIVNKEDPFVCAKLISDIDASASDPEKPGYNSANAWTPIGRNNDVAYTGVFDGDGHVITGLTFDDSSADYAGLFGNVVGVIDTGGIVKNVGLEDGTITGGKYVGGVVGFNGSGIISNCYNTGGVSGGSYVGGVVGHSGSGNISNCYNTGEVSGIDSAGGVAGTVSLDKVTNCFNTGAVSSADTAGGVTGANIMGKVTNCFNTGDVSGTRTVGGVVGYYFGTTTNCYYDRSRVTIPGASEDNNWKAIGSGTDGSVTGLTTAQMTGANALDNMVFEFGDGEVSPWQTKANGADVSGKYYWFYPHLKGFNLDENGEQIPARNIQPEDWPAKAEVSVTLSEYSYGYNGDPKIPSVTSVKIGDKTLELDRDYTVSYCNESGMNDLPVNAGNYKAVVTFTASDHAPIEKEFKITSKAVTVTAASEEFTYDGTAHSNDGYTVSGLVGSDAIAAVVTGSITYPSDSPVDNVLKSYNFTSGIPENYTVTTKNGRLTMSNASIKITITAASDSWTYDGSAHTNSSVTVTSGELLTGDSLVATANGSVTNVSDTAAGNNRIAPGYKIMHGTEDVTANYVITAVDGTLTINPASVTLTANSRDTDVYDGTGKTVTGFTSSVEGLTFDGVNASGSGTDAGEYDVTFTGVTINETKDSTGNYVVTEVKNGTLKINRAYVTVTITGHFESAPYDGREHTVSGYDFEPSDPLYKETDVKFTGTDKATRTDVGTTNMGLMPEQFENINDNFVVDYNVTDGYVTIVAVNVTVAITGNSDTVAYNGEEQSVSGYEFTCSNPLYTEADFEFSGAAEAKRTEPGTESMDLDAGQFTNKNANFIVTFTVEEDGKLTVNPVVTFADEDGTELQSGAVALGTTPEYKGETPVKESDGRYSYTFDKWTPDITEANENATYTATYTAEKIEYTAKFVADGKTVKEEKFTFETEKLDEPEVPAKDGYEGKWSEYKLAASDTKINAVYTPVEYTATFIADGKTVKEIKYTVETKSIEAPEVPAKEGYTGEWEEYTLTPGGITVNAVYTENENPEPADLCPLDEKDHGDSFFGKLVRFIHTIIWKLFRLFGMNIYFRIG